MPWHTCYSLASLLRTARELSASCDTVTFDIFDTLLIRRIHDPDLVKPAVARFIAARARNLGLRWTWPRVQTLRDRFEKEQRRQTAIRFDDHEACYPDYMARVLREIFADGADEHLLAEVTDYELAVENTMLVARDELVQWLRELHAGGKRIFLLSDIYLPASHLARLVEHAGFLDCIEGIVSSADSFLAKASGKAFPLLKEKYGLGYDSWLHVGDNPISDGLRPAEHGIRALVIRDGLEKYRKAIVKRYVNYSAGRPFWKGRTVQQLMLPLEGENRPRSFRYGYGYTVLAPLICAFVHDVAKRCLENDIPRIFFFSREGWLFQRVWEKITPHLYPAGRLPATGYLYVSRMALAGASCAYQGLTRTSADIVFLPAGNRDFRDICRVFNLQVEPLVPHLARFGLRTDIILNPRFPGFDPAHTLRLYDLLDDGSFQDEVRRQTRPANDALQRYLEDSGFFEQEQVALVDIGWLGTIQRFLYDAVKHREDAPRFVGLLFGASRGIPYPTTLNNRLEGVIYDRDRFDLAASTIMYARDLFEEACRAPHPTLNGYRLTAGGGYELEFRTADDAMARQEHEQNRYFAPLQNGVVDAADRYGAAMALLGYSPEEIKPWLRYLLASRLAFPRAAEVGEIRQRHHLDDFHGTHVSKARKKRGEKGLWDMPPWVLRCRPLIRLKYFLFHIKQCLRGA